MLREEFARSLSVFLDDVGATSICFHTDVLSLGAMLSDLPQGKRNLPGACASMLSKATGGRTLLFPTFNYDYFGTRLYRPDRDPCQVGAVNEHFRALPETQRTLTPVFNFGILNGNPNFSAPPQAVPFSDQSTFAEMCRAETWLAFLGAPLARSTLIHLCEYRANVGFRYRKPFPGIIRRGNEETTSDFSFRVRVIHSKMPVTFDWERLEREMAAAGIVRYLPGTERKVLLYRADLAVDFWLGILKKDELGLYTPEGKRSVQELYDTLGYPLTLEMFEAPQ